MSSWCHFANAFDHDDEVQLNTFISKLSSLFLLQYHLFQSYDRSYFETSQIKFDKLLPSIWKCAEDVTAKMWHRPYGGQLRGRRCLPKGHKPWFTPKYQSGEQDYGQHILPCHCLYQTLWAHRVRLWCRRGKVKKTLNSNWHPINPGGYYILAVHTMFVVFPLLSVMWRLTGRGWKEALT